MILPAAYEYLGLRGSGMESGTVSGVGITGGLWYTSELDTSTRSRT